MKITDFKDKIKYTLPEWNENQYIYFENCRYPSFDERYFLSCLSLDSINRNDWKELKNENN